MPTFAYEAVDSAGKAVNATIDAASVDEARAQLRKKKLFPTSISQKRSGGKKKAAIAKHQDRLGWAQSHISPLLAHLGQSADAQVSVRGLVVCSRELAGPYLHDSALPVKSVHALSKDLEAGRLFDVT